MRSMSKWVFNTMKLEGILYAENSARAFPAEVVLEGDTLHLLWQEEDAPAQSLSRPVAECQLSEPMGKTMRAFVLPDGKRVEFQSPEALRTLAEWETRTGRSSLYGRVHWLEERWAAVLLAGCLLLAALGLGYFRGVPLLADWAARKMPDSVSVTVTEKTVEILTKILRLKESKLPAERRQTLETQFLAMAAEMDPGSRRNYRLLFRSTPIPNAAALPDGLVLVTDNLVELAKDDREIYGVLAHEIVHVREMHGMRSVLQNSAIFFVWTLLSGDLSTVAGVGAAVPTALAESRYSRKFEHEADLGAAEYMVRAGWGTAPLRNILSRIDPEYRHVGGVEEIFASHPMTENRARFFEEYEKGKVDR
jgi:Zn-dependent protease with chaperone function